MLEKLNTIVDEYNRQCGTELTCEAFAEAHNVEIQHIDKRGVKRTYLILPVDFERVKQQTQKDIDNHHLEEAQKKETRKHRRVENLHQSPGANANEFVPRRLYIERLDEIKEIMQLMLSIDGKRMARIDLNESRMNTFMLTLEMLRNDLLKVNSGINDLKQVWGISDSNEKRDTKPQQPDAPQDTTE